MWKRWVHLTTMPPRSTVREVIQMLEADGWVQVTQRGSHLQFRHSVKPGKVTVAGAPGSTAPPGTLASIYRQAGWR